LNLRDALREMLGRDLVLIGLDFDGTLAPLVDHPRMAEPHRRSVELIALLTHRPSLRLAVVSGRALADLEDRLGALPGVALIGEHGNDVGLPVAPSPILLSARAFLASLQRDHPLSIVETKPHSVTMNTRRLDVSSSGSARREIEEWAQAHPDLSLIEGKDVVELTMGSRTKGDVIAELSSDCDGTIYIGDDLTDETVFARLQPGDIGIKVGEGETAARFRVADTLGVLGVLEEIALASA
jgi:trehalose-phosphatase